jgi:hypothetical protein
LLKGFIALDGAKVTKSEFQLVLDKSSSFLITLDPAGFTLSQITSFMKYVKHSKALLDKIKRVTGLRQCLRVPAISY